MVTESVRSHGMRPEDRGRGGFTYLNSHWLLFPSGLSRDAVISALQSGLLQMNGIQ